MTRESGSEQVEWEGLKYLHVSVVVFAHTLTEAGPSAMMGKQTERGGEGTRERQYSGCTLGLSTSFDPHPTPRQGEDHFQSTRVSLDHFHVEHCHLIVTGNRPFSNNKTFVNRAKLHQSIPRFGSKFDLAVLFALEVAL